jgi:quinol---cytochrome c reductase iron-sulfur subunit
MTPVRRPPPPSGAALTAAFSLSAAASLGLTVTYWVGGQPQVEGALIAVALGGLSAGIILFAKRFLPPGPYVQEREPLPSTAAEREAFARDFGAAGEGMARRGFLKALAAAIGALGLAALFPIRSLGPKPGRTLFRTAWRRGSRLVTSDGGPVTIGDLEVGGILTVFPEGHTGAADSQTLLIRVDPALLRSLPGRETWAPEGYVCYSKICTHAGCPVGLYEAESHRLFCPCHQSVFDVLDGAKPTAGPATRPLPQLPIQIGQGGSLQAQGDYEEPVGPGFWNRP